MMAGILGLLIIPFLAFGHSLEQWAQELKESPPPPGTTAALIVGLLSTDVLLPVPSSVISTLGGWQLGCSGYVRNHYDTRNDALHHYRRLRISWYRLRECVHAATHVLFLLHFQKTDQGCEFFNG